MAFCHETVVTVEPWGLVNGSEVKKFTLKNNNGLEVDVISYGATIVSIRTLDKQGIEADVVLGFENIEGYLAQNNPYFGATIGRVANRIAKGHFILDGVEYNLTKSNDEYSLHGGLKGWNAYVWNAEIQKNTVVMSLLSEDGDEGYPGAVIATAKFSLTNHGELIIEVKATATKATPINLTNHSYFNLAGHGTHASELYNHEIEINADRWTVTNSESIPTGEIRSVANSIMDLRTSTRLGDVIDKVPGGDGYDHNFCLSDNDKRTKQKFVAKVFHPNSGRYLEVRSDQPGVQLYTSNFLPESTTYGIAGKDGAKYFKHEAFCLETQNYPDAVNHENFPDSILRPGYTYSHTTTYKFGVQI